MEPKTDSADDKVASELGLQFYVSIIHHPLSHRFTIFVGNIKILLKESRKYV